MKKFLKNSLLKLLEMLDKDEKRHNSSPEINEIQSEKVIPDEKNSPIQRRWKKDYKPLRRLVLWGWDDNNNPSFLILYGRHDFNSDKKSKDGYVLTENVKYTSYAVFKGKGGHLPSSKAVKIIEEGQFKMYYKKGLKYDWGWSADNEFRVKEFYPLESNQLLSIPYFTSMPYEQVIKTLEGSKITFKGFKTAKSSNEILKLDGSLAAYSSLVIDILSHQSLYMRKKLLNDLLEKSPPKELFEILLNIGSTEVISGLFMALAKLGNPVLAEEAKVILESELNWADGNFAKGVKRCIKVYINVLDPAFKASRIKWIRESLTKMDLHLTKIREKDVLPEKVIEGAAYRKYAAQGLFSDYRQHYDYQERKYVKTESPKRYEPGPYNDGVRLKLIDFKNTIQEAEIYGLADVIGRVAYYLDAPRLTYYLKGSGKSKALKYFHRYLRRVINVYAVSNEDRFMEAMKHLLTGYKPEDYVSKYPGNFQYNEFLKYYLYHDFNEKPPNAWNHWRAWQDWVNNDQHMRLEGRYEYMKEIWDRHLEVVADIAIGAEVNQVVKACYYILKDSPNAQRFIENISYRQLVKLTLVDYKPLASMFKEIFKNKLDQMHTFDPDLMLALIDCRDEKMNALAMDYFKRTHGSFTAETVADMLLLDNLQQWTELFRQNLLSLTCDSFAPFVKELISRTGKFIDQDRILPDDIKDILTLSANQIQGVSVFGKSEILAVMIDVLSHDPKLPEWLAIYIEELIFSIAYEDLESIIAEVDVQTGKSPASQGNKRILSFLTSIKNKKIPSDSGIINMLDYGTSKMIQTLFTCFTKNREDLKNRFSTLLILFESEVTVLNQLAEEVFDALPQEKQKKLHGILIDSPVPRAYLLGLRKLDTIYKDVIPGEFILQMMEHGSPNVKAYISNKINYILDHPGDGNQELFMYYVKTLLLMPNKHSKSKDRVYAVLPQFALTYKEKLDEIESTLMDIGGSNIIKDSERALMALATIRKAGEYHAS